MPFWGYSSDPTSGQWMQDNGYPFPEGQGPKEPPDYVSALMQQQSPAQPQQGASNMANDWGYDYSEGGMDPRAQTYGDSVVERGTTAGGNDFTRYQNGNISGNLTGGYYQGSPVGQSGYGVPVGQTGYNYGGNQGSYSSVMGDYNNTIGSSGYSGGASGSFQPGGAGSQWTYGNNNPYMPASYDPNATAQNAASQNAASNKQVQDMLKWYASMTQGGGSAGGVAGSTPMAGGSTTTNIPQVDPTKIYGTGDMQPFQGGANIPQAGTNQAQFLTMAGFNPQQAQKPMDDTLMKQYMAFLQNPSSAMSNPMYQAMMDAGLLATQRGMSAGGYNGSGNMLEELQKKGMGIAGQYLPQMASMYATGAGTEANRYGIQNAANVNYGQLGTTLGAQNLQQGQLGLNQWNSNAADQLARLQMANQNQSYNTNLGLGMQAQAQTNPTIQNLLQQLSMSNYGGY